MIMKDLVKRIDQLKIKYETLKKEIARKIVGQEEIIDKILVAIFSNGHCLLIGVPGLAKTLMAATQRTQLSCAWTPNSQIVA